MNNLSRKNGFTLAEILGVIVVSGLLMVLVAPIIMNRIENNKKLADETGNKIVFDAARQFVDENSDTYLSGNRYCVSIKELIDDGKLTSPILDIKTGKNIEDYSVLVTIYKSGLKNYMLYNKDDCVNEEAKPIVNLSPLIEASDNCSNGTVSLKFKDRSGSGLRRYAISDSEKSEDELDWIDLNDETTVSYNPNPAYNSNYIYLQDVTGNIGKLVHNPYSEHTILFDANGGTVNSSSIVVRNFKTYGNLPTPTRYLGGLDIFTFEGWFTAKTGGTKIVNTNQVCLNNNQTLYAHWSVNNDITIKSYLNCKKSVDVTGGVAANGRKIQIYGSNASNAQRWIPVFNSNGSVSFKSKINQNYCLDVTNGKIANGSLLQLYTCNNSNAQKFKAVKNSDGTTTFKMFSNNSYCIDVPGAIVENGRQLNIYSCNNSDAQKWVSKCPNDTSAPTCGTVTKSGNDSSKTMTVTVGCSDTGGSGCPGTSNNFKATYSSSQSGTHSITIFDRAGNEKACSFNISWNNCKTGSPNQCVGGWNQEWRSCASKVWNSCASKVWNSCASKVWNSCATTRKYTKTYRSRSKCTADCGNSCSYADNGAGSLRPYRCYLSECVGKKVCQGAYVCKGATVCQGAYVNTSWNNCKTKKNTCKAGWN